MGLLDEESSFIVAVGLKLSKVASKTIWDYNAPTIFAIMASYTKMTQLFGRQQLI